MPGPDFRQEIEPHHILKFQSDFEHVYQTKGSMLREHVTVKPEEGEGAVAVHLFGKATTRRSREPFRENPVSNTERQRVWYAPNDTIEWGEEIETRDLLLQMQNPESDLMMAGVDAIGRDTDEDIVLGMRGPRKFGKDFATAENEALPDSQKLLVDVGPDGSTGAQGMNLEKLRKTRTLYKTNRVMPRGERIKLAIGAQQIEDLSRFVEVTSADFFNKGEEPSYYGDGELSGVMGFEFVAYEDLPVEAGNRINLAWVKSGVQLGEWQGLNSDCWGLPNKRWIPYCYASTIIGVARKQNEAVIEIPCFEST